VEHSVLQHLDKQAARSRMIMIRAWGQRNHCVIRDKEFSREVKRLFPQAILQRLRILQLLLGVNQGKQYESDLRL
jgi:hypothetical protein